MQVKSPCLETRGIQEMCVKKGREYHRYRKKRKEGVRTGVFSKPDYKSRRMGFLKGFLKGFVFALG